MYEIRKISLYIPIIHSRYYIDTNGVVYTSLGVNTTRITINGEIYNINGFKKTILPNLDPVNNLLEQIPKCKNYYLLYDGTVLKRLSTRINTKNEVDVCLTTLTGRDKGERFVIHRLMGKVFLGITDDLEIHHIDRNRTNNKLDNLMALTQEEHRGKDNFKNNHK